MITYEREEKKKAKKIAITSYIKFKCTILSWMVWVSQSQFTVKHKYLKNAEIVIFYFFFFLSLTLMTYPCELQHQVNQKDSCVCSFWRT